jgi:NAD(P)-dependent dehydrogenase (short-subunit alcohol dehydrogenase family)
MELRDKVAVVTGGASGIGRALARRFAAEGARGVVVADLDGAGAERVAVEIASASPAGAGAPAAPAVAVRCDVTDPGHADALIAAAERAFGPVDLFCANAGVAVGVDMASPAEWDLAFGVNVRAHITAAERLLPGWLERGSGYFLTTASAAGIASQIGSAPYAVTKHAAVAFAEWLAITYGDRGVGVSCLCPMGVNTAMLGEDSLALRVVAAAAEVLEPEDVATAVVDGLAAETFLILPHPEVLEFFRRKAADYDRWLAGMRRLQARIASAT